VGGQESFGGSGAPSDKYAAFFIISIIRISNMITAVRMNERRRCHMLITMYRLGDPIPAAFRFAAFAPSNVFLCRHAIRVRVRVRVRFEFSLIIIIIMISQRTLYFVHKSTFSFAPNPKPNSDPDP